MKRAVVLVCLVWSGVLCAQNAANAPVDDKIDSPLEYYFGALALIALVSTWVWVILKLRKFTPHAQEEAGEPATENDS